MSRIVIVVAVAIVLSVGSLGIYATAQSQATAHVVEDENFTTSSGVIEFDDSRKERVVYGGNETVIIENGSTVFDRSVNYTWNEHNGTITVNQSSDLASEDYAFATYRYSSYDETGWMIYQTIGLVMNVLGMMVLVVGFGVFLLAIAAALGAWD